MKNRLMAILIVTTVCITGCGDNTSESSESSMLHEQLESNYLEKVKYTEENKDVLQSDIEEICNVYIGKNVEELNIQSELSDNVEAQLSSISEQYETSEYYYDVEEMKKEAEEKGEEYSPAVSISYCRDCTIAHVSLGSHSYRIKLVYDDGEIESLVEYKL